MNAEPMVTIAIPTRNRARFIDQAVTSALAQTYPHIEVVVSDNASDDETPAILARYTDPRLRVIRQASNIGMAGNFNACLENAAGQYFVALSDDDRLHSAFVEELLTAYREQPEICFAYTRPVYFDGQYYSYRGSTSPATEDGFQLIQEFWAGRRALFPSTSLFRTADIRSVGGYPLDFPYTLDAAVWMRIALRGRVGHVPRYLCIYGVHPESASSMMNAELVWRDCLKIVMLSMQEAAGRGLDCELLAGHLEAGLRWSRRLQIVRLIRLAQAGQPRIEILKIAIRLRRFVLADWTFAIPCVLALVVLPFRMLTWLRARYFALMSQRSLESSLEPPWG